MNIEFGLFSRTQYKIAMSRVHGSRLVLALNRARRALKQFAFATPPRGGITPKRRKTTLLFPPRHSLWYINIYAFRAAGRIYFPPDATLYRANIRIPG